MLWIPARLGYQQTRFIWCLLFAFNFTACSLFQTSKPEVPGSVAGSETKPAAQSSIVPIEIVATAEQSQAVDNGSGKRVHVVLKAKTDVPTSAVRLRFLGLRNGLVVEQREKPLSEMIADTVIPKDSEREAGFSFENSDLTDFQVVLAWNLDPVPAPVPVQEAKIQPETLVGKSSDINLPKNVGEGPQGASKLAISRFETEQVQVPCSAAPCPIRYTVHAVLTNSLPASVGNVHLALGMFWVNEGSDPVLPAAGAKLSDSESEIPLDGVVIPPGQSTTVHLDLDRDIPIVPGGKFIPHLRVISYN